MILFFECISKNIIAVSTTEKLPEIEIEKLCWLFGEASFTGKESISETFI